MSAERPWEHFNRDELEGALATQAAQIARLTTEAQGMAEVLAMQMEAMSPRPIARVDDKWFERLVDLLELYLVRTVGERNPVAIADPDLRALVSHIRD